MGTPILVAPAGSLEGENVLVTGSTRGIGLAIARAFVIAGAQVTGTGRTQADLDRIKSELGERFHPFRVDLLEAAERDRMAEQLDGQPFTALVNNAGANRHADIREIDNTDWRAMLELNLTAPMELSRTFARGMAERRLGRIVHISSIWAFKGRARRAAYATTKTALVGLTRSMAVDLGPNNVLVNAVCPGFTDTEMTRRMLGEAEREQLVASVPLGRMAEPEEIANLVVFLGSHLNTYITGQAVVIDGGFTIQ